MAAPVDGAADAAKKWDEYRKLLPRIAVAAFRATLNEARNEGVKQFTRSGVGRAVWGHNDPKKGRLLAKDVRKYIKRVRVREIGSRFESGLDVAGIPALVLTGGRTKPFTVTARGKGLAFANKSGDRIVVKQARFSRGIQFRKDEFLRGSRQVLEREYPSKVEKGQQRALKRLGLI